MMSIRLLFSQKAAIGWAEAAIHAMKSIFEGDETEVVILIEASNEADDAVGAEKVKNFKIWWDELVSQGQ